MDSTTIKYVMFVDDDDGTEMLLKSFKKHEYIVMEITVNQTLVSVVAHSLRHVSLEHAPSLRTSLIENCYDYCHGFSYASRGFTEQASLASSVIQGDGDKRF